MLLLVISWIIYLASHSLLASNVCKEWVANRIGLKGAGYRLVYSLISIAGLSGVGWLIKGMPNQHLFDAGVLIYVGCLLIILGIIVVWMSFRFLSGMVFIGFKEVQSENHLVTEGIHARVRHPIYTGTIAILLGYFIIQPTDVVLISVALILIYLPIGIYFEEKKLQEEFGEDYLRYKKKVPALFPLFRSLFL